MLLGMSSFHKILSNVSNAQDDYVYSCSGWEAGEYVWTSFSLLGFAIGFPASVYIPWMMFQTHRRRGLLTPHEFFILNLSIMDSVSLLFIIPGVLNNYLWRSSVVDSVSRYFYALTTCGSPLLMACICLDCYVAVVHPVLYHQKRSLVPRVVMVAVVWTLTVVTGTVYNAVPVMDITVVSAVAFLFAISLIVTCNCLIIHSLCKSDPGRRNIHPQKQRAIQTLIYSLLMVVIAYLPPVLLFIVGKLLITDQKTYMCTINITIDTTHTVGSAALPLIILYNLGQLSCFRLPICKSSF